MAVDAKQHLGAAHAADAKEMKKSGASACKDCRRTGKKYESIESFRFHVPTRNKVHRQQDLYIIVELIVVVDSAQDLMVQVIWRRYLGNCPSQRGPTQRLSAALTCNRVQIPTRKPMKPQRFQR